MGGGGSSSNKTINQIDVSPVTNIDFDELAEAIREGNLSEAQAQEAQRKIALAQLNIENQSNQLELRKQLSTESALESAKKGVTLAALGVGGYFIYKEMKKGKK